MAGRGAGRKLGVYPPKLAQNPPKHPLDCQTNKKTVICCESLAFLVSMKALRAANPPIWPRIKPRKHPNGLESAQVNYIQPQTKVVVYLALCGSKLQRFVFL